MDVNQYPVDPVLKSAKGFSKFSICDARRFEGKAQIGKL